MMSRYRYYKRVFVIRVLAAVVRFLQDSLIRVGNVVDFYRKVAKRLGNTAAVFRRYYVHPLAPEAYRQDVFFEVCENVDGEPPDGWLEPEERVALALLQLDLETVDR